jgi:predicted AlkP superfamily pyrophosphatase or phosphodiesterase
VGAANALRDTSCLVSRNENDSRRVPAKTTWRSPNQPANFMPSRKVLNLCEDSKRRSAVTFRTVAQNKFINCLRSNEAEANFRTTARRYADK